MSCDSGNAVLDQPTTGPGLRRGGDGAPCTSRRKQVRRRTHSSHPDDCACGLTTWGVVSRVIPLMLRMLHAHIYCTTIFPKCFGISLYIVFIPSVVGVLAWGLGSQLLHLGGFRAQVGSEQHAYSILYYTILYYTILYYTILYYTILYYIILYWR